MDCFDCKSRMRVTNTYCAGSGARTRRLRCESCGRVEVEIGVVLRTDARGARKLASDILKMGLERALSAGKKKSGSAP